MGLRSTTILTCHAFYAVSFTLAVPNFILKPHDTEAIVNCSTFFNCSTTSQEVEWRVDSDQNTFIFSFGTIKSAYIDRFRIESNNRSGTFNLVISSVKPSDARRYTCRDVESGTEQDAELIVLVSEPSCDLFIIDGNNGSQICGIYSLNVTVSCSIAYFGNEAPTLEWIEGNTTINPSLVKCSDSNNLRTCNLTLEVDIQEKGLSYVCQTSKQHYQCSPEIEKSLSADCKSETYPFTSPSVDTSQPSAGTIISIVIGVLTLILIGTGIGLFVIYRKHRKRSLSMKNQSQQEQDIGLGLMLDSDKIIPEASKTQRSRVRGLAILNNKLFIAMRQSHKIEVYNATTLEEISPVQLEGLQEPGTMVSCNKENCLYVVDKKFTTDKPEIFKFTPEGKVLKKWIVWNYGRLSITEEGNIILAAYKKTILNEKVRKELSMLIEYSPKGETLDSIEFEISSNLNYIMHAVKISNDEFLIVQGCYFGDSLIHRVCRINRQQQILQSLGGEPGSGSEKLNEPCNLVFRKGTESVLVADMRNNRIITPMPYEKWRQAEELFNENKIERPNVLCLDEVNNRLFVGCNSESSKDYAGYVVCLHLNGS